MGDKLKRVELESGRGGERVRSTQTAGSFTCVKPHHTGVGGDIQKGSRLRMKSADSSYIRKI